MHIDKLPRFPLAQLPTPIETLPRLSHELGGPDLLIKRDDQTGLALGGNKTRKLEFLVGDALAHGADTLVTVGAAQSNHCRQTAAAAARAGFQCELILNGTKPDLPNGNLLLNQLFGATEHWIDRTQRTAKLRELPEPEHLEYESEVAQIANACAAYIGSDVRLGKADIKVVYGYMGEGYGVVGNLEREAIRLMARCEGIVLDPVYAGRAFGALVDLIRQGAFKRGETVLFWHTGGAPALFAYAKELI